MEQRQIVIPEIELIPHHELSYDDTIRRDASSYTLEQIRNFDKAEAVLYARATGFSDTGMSPNEIGLLYDLLEKKRPKNIVELGRNWGCSTRILLQYVVRHGGMLESWDLKQWGNLIDTFRAQGFTTSPSNHESPEDYFLEVPEKGVVADIRVADSMKTNIGNVDRWVDFLLIDTEHGLENALGEYMRWRQYMRSGCIIAFHDAELPAVHRALEMVIEVESDFGGRIVKHYKNERVDGFGIEAFEWKG